MRGRTTPLAPSRFLEALPENAVEPFESKSQQALGVDELAAMTETLLARLSNR